MHLEIKHNSYNKGRNEAMRDVKETEANIALLKRRKQSAGKGTQMKLQQQINNLRGLLYNQTLQSTYMQGWVDCISGIRKELKMLHGGEPEYGKFYVSPDLRPDKDDELPDVVVKQKKRRKKR